MLSLFFLLKKLLIIATKFLNSFVLKDNNKKHKFGTTRQVNALKTKFHTPSPGRSEHKKNVNPPTKATTIV